MDHQFSVIFTRWILRHILLQMITKLYESMVHIHHSYYKFDLTMIFNV